MSFAIHSFPKCLRDFSVNKREKHVDHLFKATHIKNLTFEYFPEYHVILPKYHSAQVGVQVVIFSQIPETLSLQKAIRSD